MLYADDLKGEDAHLVGRLVIVYMNLNYFPLKPYSVVGTIFNSVGNSIVMYPLVIGLLNIISIVSYVTSSTV